MSKEKQIEEIFNIIVDGIIDGDDNNGVPTGRTCNVIAETLYNAGYRKQSEWISVNERLPEESVEVIVALRIGDRLAVDTDRIHGGKWFAYGKNGYRGAGYITHWMPLPEPPKGEQ